MTEEYKKFKTFPDYRIYNTGRIYSEKTKRFLKVTDDKHGYDQVTLYKGTKKNRTTIKVHILVAKAFVPNPFNYTEINHINYNKKDNNYINLEWVTRQENMIHASKHGYKNREELSPLTKEQVCLIPELIKARFSIQLISKLYKVGHITIRNIIKRKSWKHLNLHFEKCDYMKGVIPISKDLYYKLKCLNVDNTVLNSRVKMLESV